MKYTLHITQQQIDRWQAYYLWTRSSRQLPVPPSCDCPIQAAFKEEYNINVHVQNELHPEKYRILMMWGKLNPSVHIQKWLKLLDSGAILGPTVLEIEVPDA